MISKIKKKEEKVQKLKRSFKKKFFIIL